MVGRRTGYLQYSHVREVLASDNNPLHAYWRIGDDAGLNSQAMYDYISPEISAQATTSLDMIDFKANRTLWDLPGGPLALAVGAEYRRTQVELTPLTHTDAGDIIGLGYSAYKGTEKVGVLRAELLAQGVLQERVLLRSDLQRAERVWLINSVRGWVPMELARA